jgi:hypothetical protein
MAELRFLQDDRETAYAFWKEATETYPISPSHPVICPYRIRYIL